MKRLLALLGISSLILSLATACMADEIALYSAETYKTFGDFEDIWTTSQLCRPSTSTNRLTEGDTVWGAGMRLRVAPDSNLTTRLIMRPWTGEYWSTLNSQVFVDSGLVYISGGATGREVRIEVDRGSWSAGTTGGLLLTLEYHGGAGTGNDWWGIWSSSSNDGGSGNDAYDEMGEVLTDREYQVYLQYTPVPEPTSILALAGGLGCLFPLIRRPK